MVEFDSPFCLENCCVVSSRIQGLGKPPNISKTFESPLTPDSISTPTDLSPINCSLSDSISLGLMQTDVHPFVKVSPISDVSIPPDILPNFSLLFSEDRNPILTHRPGKLNSQINSLSCCEDYKANSESSNFQRILTSTGIITHQGPRLLNAAIQNNLDPRLAFVVGDVNFFYDGPS
ncbi:hypothetical protein BASA81_017514 [Batrachochytrium salamandrivorans]|nr:hypothetical protein BASA81_017514 [Batrachochytrium salamandrivorans]